VASNNHLNPTQVGRRIRKRRLEIGSSQRDLQTAGVTYAYISRIEAGDRTPSLSALIVMAEQLRDRAAAEIARVEAFDDDDYDYQPRLDELHRIEDETTALYLLTGSAHDTCPFCGRHEQGATTDGKPKHGRR
jgi:transcriptional regulator with XRE-family HTH domain